MNVVYLTLKFPKCHHTSKHQILKNKLSLFWQATLKDWPDVQSHVKNWCFCGLKTFWLRPCASSVLFIHTFHARMTSRDKKSSILFPWMTFLSMDEIFHPLMIFKDKSYLWIINVTHGWIFLFFMFWDENWKKSKIPRAICIKTFSWYMMLRFFTQNHDKLKFHKRMKKIFPWIKF